MSTVPEFTAATSDSVLLARFAYITASTDTWAHVNSLTTILSPFRKHGVLAHSRIHIILQGRLTDFQCKIAGNSATLG